MTTAHGWFHERHRNRPMVLATVTHPAIAVLVPLPFIVDTGAECTVIVPQWEEVLRIPDSAFQEPQDRLPMESIGGQICFRFLPDCRLVLSDRRNQCYPIGPLGICSFSRKHMDPENLPLTGEPDFPNVLGRDVLEKLSLGYCQKSGCLFVTEDTASYKDALGVIFPRPYDPNDPSISWAD